MKNERVQIPVGTEVEIPGAEGPRRGWISERTSEEEVLVSLYRDGEEVPIAISEILESSLYGPELPVPEGFAAIDMLTEDGSEVIFSIRMSSDEYRRWTKAADSAGEELGEFLQRCIVARLESELDRQSASRGEAL